METEWRRGNLGRQMANDAMPLAREARTRLEYRAIQIVSGEHEIKSGEARKKGPPIGRMRAGRPES